MAGRENAGKQSCVAGVLAGGSSRRFGRAKALLAHPHGKTLIEHVVDAALAVPSSVVILGRSCALPASLSKLPVLPDARPQAGPLAGLCTLLKHAVDRWTLLLACDMPFLSPDVLQRLLSHRAADWDAVAFTRDARPSTHHTCCALYHPRIHPAALDELTNGRRSLQTLLTRIRTCSLHPGAHEVRQLTNVNTPDDFARIGQRT